MRLKTYSAPTVAEAIGLVRAEMGDDAIIVSTQRAGKGQGARVTAALETPVHDDGLDVSRCGNANDAVEELRQALAFHGTPKALLERLLASAPSPGTADPILAAAAALDSCFSFAPLPEGGHSKPVMLIGPPGVGKTVTVAKLAARAVLAGRKVDVITADTQRAGAIEQLSAFTRILNIDLQTADVPEALARIVARRNTTTPLYIDTAGANPFSATEVEYLSALVAATRAEPVLVLAAGGDVMESAEIAASLTAIGPTRLLVTRLDMARRLGGILAAAEAGSLRFCDVSVTPHVAEGLSPVNPLSLARLIMPHPSRVAAAFPLPEAAS